MKRFLVLFVLIAPIPLIALTLPLNTLKNRACIVEYTGTSERCIGFPVSETVILVKMTCAVGSEEIAPRLPKSVICDGVTVNVEIDPSTHKYTTKKELNNPNMNQTAREKILSLDWVKMNIVDKKDGKAVSLSKQSTISLASAKQQKFIMNAYKKLPLSELKEGTICTAVKFKVTQKKKADDGIKTTNSEISRIETFLLENNLVKTSTTHENMGHLFCFVFDDQYLDDRGCLDTKEEDKNKKTNVCLLKSAAKGDAAKKAKDVLEYDDPTEGALVLFAIESDYDRLNDMLYWAIPKL